MQATNVIKKYLVPTGALAGFLGYLVFQNFEITVLIARLDFHSDLLQQLVTQQGVSLDRWGPMFFAFIVIFLFALARLVVGYWDRIGKLIREIIFWFCRFDDQISRAGSRLLESITSQIFLFRIVTLAIGFGVGWLSNSLARSGQVSFGSMVVLVCLATAAVEMALRAWRQGGRRYLWGGIAAGVLLKAAIAFLFVGNTDMAGWQQTVELIKSGQSAYLSGRYNYPPLWSWFLIGADWLAAASGMSFHFIVRLPLIFADVAIAWLAYSILRRSSYGEAGAVGLAAVLAVNPISVLISGYHGQFDNLAYLWLVALLYVESRRGRSVWLKGVLLGLGMATKQVVAMVAPFLFFKERGWPRRILFGCLSAVIVGVFLAGPFMHQSAAVIRNVFSYNSWYGYGFVQLIVDFLNLAGLHLFAKLAGAALLFLGKYLLILSLAIIGWKFSRLPTAHGIKLSLLFVYAFTHAFAWQYLIWLVPFAFILPDRFLKYFMLFGGLYLFTGYLGGVSGLPVSLVSSRVFGNLTWLLCLVWFFYTYIEYRQLLSADNPTPTLL